MDAITIASTMLNRKHLNSWQIQKSLFYGQALSLYLTGTVLFNDPIAAWKNGPVVPKVRKAYQNNELQYFPKVNNDDVDTNYILQYVYKYFLKKTGQELRDLTHISGGAWEKTVRAGLKYIPLTYIKDEILLFPEIVEELKKPFEIKEKYVYKDLDKILEKHNIIL